MKKKQIFFAFLVCLLLAPLWMWMAWLVTPKKKLVSAIIDKSTLTSLGQEHISFNWILNNLRYTKTSTLGYDPSRDYFGFKPLKKEKFNLTGLERFTDAQLEQLSNDCDLVYYTDTYGIYVNEWYRKRNIGERSGVIYGGMSDEDITYLSKMKLKNKLIITEFNTIGSPTSPVIRGKFERLFGLKWSGWTCRFFSSFDTSINLELPKWMVHNYKERHNGKWPFTGAGIAFIKNKGDVVILEDGKDLNFPVPLIKLTSEGKDADVNDNTKYPYWIDIIEPDNKTNKVLANFEINVTEKGAEILNRYSLPAVIPAVTKSRSNHYPFYYFSGDFCDNDVDFSSSYYKGISVFKNLLYSSDDLMERESFFWNFYKPLMSGIINDYYVHQHLKK